MDKPRLTLPYSLVTQAAADLRLGGSYPTSTWFDAEMLERMEQVLKNTLKAALNENIVIDFVK